jgi:hypothetical protein
MLHTSKLRNGSRIGFTRSLSRFGAALVLAILLPLAASAYTVVLKNGRVLEIPDNFEITRAGITYEHAPGLYVTIQMTSIDVAATERANNQPTGSLLNRAVAKTKTATASDSSSRPVRRTLTDKELEGVRRRREESEALYERRRVELGLPSLEEMRRQRAEETRRLSEMAARSYEEEAQSESYWRQRASELRTAMAVNDAEINYLRARLGEESDLYPTLSYSSQATSPFIWPVPNRFPRPAFPSAPVGTPFPRRPVEREPITGRAGSDGDRRSGPIILNPGYPYRGFPRRRGFGAQGINAFPLPFYAPYSYNYSYDQGALLTRLRELKTERAGLQARWRLLEDEARRAGAPPGWLRP